MSMVWMALIMASVVLSMMTGQLNAAEALLTSGEQAVKLMLTLLGSMTLWSGLMEILHEAGDVSRFACCLKRWGNRTFPELQDDAWEAMSLNVAANMLGLGNAATPAGVRAAQLLSAQGECGLRALAMLLVLNSTGMTLLPATVISMRQAAGSQDAAGIWLPSLISSFVASMTGVSVLMLTGRKKVCRE